MRVAQLPDGSRGCSRVVVALLAGACTLLPMNVSAQEAGFLVRRSTNLYSKDFNVWTATCKGIKEGALKQEVTCVLEQQVCEPGKCPKPFDIRSDDAPPLALTFGVARYNDTCAWVFNWTVWRYTYKCW
jgi:hypothetical protein